jgi:hypothetical protein
MKHCVTVRIEGMTPKDYAKLCAVVRKAFPDNTIEIFTFRKEWEQ